MDKLKAIEFLCNEFMVGICHNGNEKSRFENWRTSTQDGKVFLTFDAWQAMGESSLTMANKPSKGDPYAPIENMIFIVRSFYINQKYPLRKHAIKLCLTGLKHKVIGTDILFIYNEENDFSLDSEAMPQSWGNLTTIPAPPTDNLKGMVIYFTFPPYGMDWAENIIQNLIAEVEAYFHLVETDNNGENHTQKELDELRKLLG